MDLGNKGDLVILEEISTTLPKIRSKYWELGRRVNKEDFPKEFKDNFYSLGNDLEKLLKLTKILWH